VTDVAGKVAKLEWVEREMDAASEKSGDPAVVLFFEVGVPEGIGGWSLTYSVFNEVCKDQVNLVQFRSGARKIELRFGGDELVKKLSL